MSRSARKTASAPFAGLRRPGPWNKVVVAREDEDDTMLNHALIQRRRHHSS
jgi:hypothetical protein